MSLDLLGSVSMPTPGSPMRRGDAHGMVTQVQYILHTLGLLTGPSWGKFDGPTEEAVRAFQRQRGIPVTGVVDLPTWAGMNAEIGKDPAKMQKLQDLVARYHLTGGPGGLGGGGRAAVGIAAALAASAGGWWLWRRYGK